MMSGSSPDYTGSLHRLARRANLKRVLLSQLKIAYKQQRFWYPSRDSHRSATISEAREFAALAMAMSAFVK
jgi:hypothetical protein